MENPHLEAQTAVLTRIVSNVVRARCVPGVPLDSSYAQEKLNEAMMELNRALGVRYADLR
jgi:hypothetical protein